jgi:hypothetical protein
MATEGADRESARRQYFMVDAVLFQEIRRNCCVVIVPHQKEEKPNGRILGHCAKSAREPNIVDVYLH